MSFGTFSRLLIVRRALALYIPKDDNLERDKDRLNVLSALLRSFITCWQSSSNHGIFGLALWYSILSNVQKYIWKVRKQIFGYKCMFIQSNRTEIFKWIPICLFEFPALVFNRSVIFSSCQNDWKVQCNHFHTSQEKRSKEDRPAKHRSLTRYTEQKKKGILNLVLNYAFFIWI